MTFVGTETTERGEVSREPLPSLGHRRATQRRATARGDSDRGRATSGPPSEVRDNSIDHAQIEFELVTAGRMLRPPGADLLALEPARAIRRVDRCAKPLTHHAASTPVVSSGTGGGAS